MYYAHKVRCSDQWSEQQLHQRWCPFADGWNRIRKTLATDHDISGAINSQTKSFVTLFPKLYVYFPAPPIVSHCSCLNDNCIVCSQLRLLFISCEEAWQCRQLCAHWIPVSHKRFSATPCWRIVSVFPVGVADWRRGSRRYSRWRTPPDVRCDGHVVLAFYELGVVGRYEQLREDAQRRVTPWASLMLAGGRREQVLNKAVLGSIILAHPTGLNHLAVSAAECHSQTHHWRVRKHVLGQGVGRN